MKLGVNIDHIAVLREARKCGDPALYDALLPCILGGADQITIHLREDRRHVDDNDAKIITALSKIPVNIECSVDAKIIEIICELKPHRATLVPEKREEVTTEGGLDIIKATNSVRNATQQLMQNDILVSYFIDPTEENVKKAKELGADAVEFHTGRYANIFLMLNSNLSRTKFAVKELDTDRKALKKALKKEIKGLKTCAALAKSLGLEVAAGHGLNYQNVGDIAKIADIEELNIGQSIIARSVFTGLQSAVREMKELI
jgi:pyridoxine 5-phosphate synthase